MKKQVKLQPSATETIRAAKNLKASCSTECQQRYEFAQRARVTLK